MRHAIYFAPVSGSLLHQLGSSWLGRDAVTNQLVRQPAIEGIREATADAHRYGFHATLKPPFALRGGMSRTDLGDTAALIAAVLDAIPGCRLEVGHIDGFLALVPVSQDQRLSALAEVCVREFDVFRAPAGEDELERRRGAGLTPRQESYLRDWGYPYVFEEFRFHITLTRRVAGEEAERLGTAAKAHFAAILDKPVVIDALTIFTEPRPGADFIDEERFPLRHATFARAAS